MRVRGKLRVDKGITLPDTGGSKDLLPEKVGYSDSSGKFIWNNFYIPVAVVGELYKINSLVIGEDGFMYRAIVDNAPVVYIVPPNTPIDPMDPTYWSSVKEGESINLQDVTNRGNFTTNDILVNNGTATIQTLISKGIITVTDNTLVVKNTSISSLGITFVQNTIETNLIAQEHTEGAPITVLMPAKSGELALIDDLADLAAVSIIAIYPTLADAIAAQGAQIAQGIYRIDDASDFSTIPGGYAYVEYLGTTLATEADYKIIGNEAKDSILKSYINLADALSQRAEQFKGALYHIQDASSFIDVVNGYAYVEYLESGSNTEAEYRLISSGSSGGTSDGAFVLYIAKEIVVPGHGFSTLDNVYSDGTNWLLANAGSFSSVKQGIIIAHDINVISVVSYGTIESIGHGLTIGATYFLSDTSSGDNTLTSPTSATSFSQVTLEVIDPSNVKILDQAITQGIDALEPGVTFTSLTDVPNSYGGAADYQVFVNNTGDALEFRAPVVVAAVSPTKGVMMSTASTQNISTATWTTLDSWAVLYNDNAYIPGLGEDTGIITIPQNGTYTLSAEGWAETSGGTIAARFLVSGSPRGFYSTVSAAGDAVLDLSLAPISTKTTLYLSAGTTISFQVFQNSGGDILFGSVTEQNYFTVTPINI